MLIHLIHASLIPLNPSEIHKSTFASSGVGCQTPLLTTLQRSVLYKLSCAMPQSWRVITIVLVRVLEKKNKLPELRRFSEICHRHFVTPLFLEKSTDFCTGETAPSFPFSFPLPRLLVYRNQCFMDHAPNVVPHGGMVHTQLLKLFSGRTSHKLSSEPDSRSLTAIH